VRFAVGCWFSSSCILAARSFGKFKDLFLLELHAEILSHEKQVENGTVPQPVQGITVVDSDVLQPPPVRQGGLQRLDTVRMLLCISTYMTQSSLAPHVQKTIKTT